MPSAEGDQLVENGLGSPLCQATTSGELSGAAQSNCQTSDFVGAPAPTNNYELDVNIDTGALGLSSGGLLSVIQDVFIAPVWNALVWVVHALVVMLQWCYTLELLGGSTMSGLRSSLREAQTNFTDPWLALVLAIASVLAFYNGLIRRRVAETLGQALLTIVMMAGGLWMIADPLGTVGAVGQFANEASLGTLGATAQGTTVDAPRTLGDSMRALFAGAIELPWCYLEFGNVRWCSDPAALEPRLREAALSIVAAGKTKLACQSSPVQRSCPSSGGTSAAAAERTAQLVREAATNGALFLAFPANLPERNSVKDESSLLHVLCQSENDTECEGPTAAQAEFRSVGGTFPRMIGVVLIGAGVLGMVTLFGLLTVHLLVSAVLSMFMLLLAPFAVLAPALGDAGRAFFTGWLGRMLGAVSSKLIFSFLLGVLLTMQRMLASLEPLGWWTQWLLISAFWWVVFLKRHQALAFVRNGGRAPAAAPTRQTLGHRFQGARQAKQDIAHPVRWAKGKLLPPLPHDEQLKKPELRRRGPGQRAPGQPDAGQQQAGGQQPVGGSQQRTGPGQRRQGGDEQSGQEQPAGQSERGGAVERIGREVGQPTRPGDGITTADPQVVVAADQVGSAAPGGPTSSRKGGDSSEKSPRIERAARLAAYASAPELDEVALPASARHRPAQPQPQAQPQSPAQQQQRRHPPRRAATESAAASRSNPVPASRSNPAPAASHLGAPNPQDMRMRTSREIMDDAREVAAGRKRQLGIEPPTDGELEP
ncbi:MAG TPA: hypothetical protein VHY18_01370 [Solirubrobacteraceae bacterium]|nr:hypothetical protein [Solirubrobacteraceae bacterium]